VAMSGRVTLVGMARWGGEGGSDRPVPRFFSTVIAWPVLWWAFCRQQGRDATAPAVFAGDEWVVTTAGQKTSGVERLGSSLDGKPGPGLSCGPLAWRSGHERRAAPIRVEQRRRTEAATAAARAPAHQRGSHSQAAANKAKPGRPPGRKTRAQTPVGLSSARPRLPLMLPPQLAPLDGAMPLGHRV
jgi:putative transposase